MFHVSQIEYYTGSKEERLPGFSEDFPYIASCMDVDYHIKGFVPWHWHKPVELFYMEKGTLEYYTPQGTLVFPEGTGGLVNSNILHMTKPRKTQEKTIQFLHIFDTAFIAGEAGGRIEQKYVKPLVSAQHLEILPLYANDSSHGQILRLLQDSFKLSESSYGYEMRLRELLSEIWIRLFELAQPELEKVVEQDKRDEKIKMMMAYIHEHYAEKISVKQLAESAYISERDCYRVFRDCLHMTPVEYVNSHRLQRACQMLAKGQENITTIAQSCGLGSSSYFGKVFHEAIGCTPMEFRRNSAESRET